MIMCKEEDEDDIALKLESLQKQADEKFLKNNWMFVASYLL